MGVNSELIAYFKRISSQLISINGNFYRQNVEEILFGTRTDIKYPYISLEKSEFNLKNDYGTIKKTRVIAFCIVYQARRADNPSAMIELLDECEDTIDEICKRIDADVKKSAITSLIGVDINSVSVVQLPFDVAQFKVGYRVVLDVVQRFNNKIDNTKWQ